VAHAAKGWRKPDPAIATVEVMSIQTPIRQTISASGAVIVVFAPAIDPRDALREMRRGPQAFTAIFAAVTAANEPWRHAIGVAARQARDLLGRRRAVFGSRVAGRVTRLLEGIDEGAEVHRSSQQFQRRQKVLGRSELSSNKYSPAGSLVEARRRRVDTVEDGPTRAEDEAGLLPIGEDLKPGKMAKLAFASIGGQERDVAQRAADASDEIWEAVE
jgi:hypothetical protein